MAKCSNCGANVSNRDRVCSYCGARNPEFQPPMDEVNVLLEQGMEAYRQARYAQAIEHFRQAIAQDPQVFNAYFYLAASLSALGREREAIEAMKKAQKIRPGSSVTYYNLALLYKRTGRAREARKCLQDALRRVDSDVALESPEKMRQRIERELRDLDRRGGR